MIIKTERNFLARLLDFLLTLLAWGCLLYLIGTGLLAYSPSGLEDALPTLRIADWSASSTLMSYLAVALFNALLLIAWARYNQLRFSGKSSRRPFAQLSANELCQHFNLDMRQLQSLRQSRVSTLEISEDGQLMHVRA